MQNLLHRRQKRLHLRRIRTQRMSLRHRLQEDTEQLLHRPHDVLHRLTRHALPVPCLPGNKAIRFRQALAEERRQLRRRISGKFRLSGRHRPACKIAQSLRRMREKLAQSFAAWHAKKSLP